jgi:hypothetical protein
MEEVLHQAGAADLVVEHQDARLLKSLFVHGREPRGARLR